MYLVAIEDDYLLDRKVKEIMRAEDISRNHFYTHTLSNNNLLEIIDDLRSVSFLNKRAFQIKNFELFSKVENESLRKQMITILKIARLSKETVIFSQNQNYISQKVVKIFKNKIIQCDKLTLSQKMIYVKEKIKEMNLKLSDSFLFNNFYGLPNNLDIIDNELTKLELLDLKKVEEYSVSAYWFMEKNEIFSFFSYWLNNNYQKMIEIQDKLTSSNFDELFLISLLSREVLKIIFVYQYKAMGYLPVKIAEKMNLPEFVARKYLSYISRYGITYIITKALKIEHFDKEIRSGRVEKALAFSLLILNG